MDKIKAWYIANVIRRAILVVIGVTIAVILLVMVLMLMMIVNA